jgi:hypothetical protein
MGLTSQSEPLNHPQKEPFAHLRPNQILTPHGYIQYLGNSVHVYLTNSSKQARSTTSWFTLHKNP